MCDPAGSRGIYAEQGCTPEALDRAVRILKKTVAGNGIRLGYVPRRPDDVISKVQVNRGGDRLYVIIPARVLKHTSIYAGGHACWGILNLGRAELKMGSPYD